MGMGWGCSLPSPRLSLFHAGEVGELAESVGGCGITFSRMGRVGVALRKPLAWFCSMPIFPARWLAS